MRSFARLCLIGVALCGFAGSAAAQSLTFGTPTPATTNAGTAANGVTVVVTYTAGGNAVAYAADVIIPAQFTSVTSNAARCSVDNPDPNRIRISNVDLDLEPLPSATVCTLTFTVADSIPAGTYNFTLCNAGNGNCQNAVARDAANVALALPVNFGSGFQVTAVGAVSPTLTFPASATATGGATTVGGVASGTVAITATGGAGGGEASYSCAAPAGFSFTGGTGAQANIGAGVDPTDITFDCTRGTTANTQNMACAVTDGAGAGRTVNVSLTCPVGNSAPDVTTSNPAPGGTVAIGGGPVGAQGSGTIVFTATPGSGTGPEATTTISCTSVAPVSIFFGANAPSQGPATFDLVGGATSATLQVRLPLTASTQNIAAAITCTENGAAFGTYSVSAGAGTTFTPPEVIPSASTWSKIALFSLLGLFGVLAVGFRRS
jgi:hypothetical protein